MSKEGLIKHVIEHIHVGLFGVFHYQRPSRTLNLLIIPTRRRLGQPSFEKALLVYLFHFQYLSSCDQYEINGRKQSPKCGSTDTVPDANVRILNAHTDRTRFFTVFQCSEANKFYAVIIFWRIT